ncbi:hypothetical protein EHW67_15620 [Arenibacter aquaticus]|uniref:Right-handed parallel beta-helix repeat-containing protein n=1 Tax=Arenibacter aquaticus TaxID=2489054 RepID=A0A430K075_9FLAO|nr:hypothetical protein EHW67_15620 [Arenibacter aquaticus]
MSNLHKKGYLLVFLVIALVYCSCRHDFDYKKSNGNLEFSKDTVLLDTVFSSIGSSTYTLKVYNRSDQDINIPTIGLKQGDQSKYRLNVDGEAGYHFTNTPLFAHDSLYIFIEVTYYTQEQDPQEFLYSDAIQFDHQNHLQEVQLVTLVQDAIFLFPNKSTNRELASIELRLSDSEEVTWVEGFELKDHELNLTNEKPYVIYGYATVPQNKTLTIGEGARLYFYKDSGLLIPNSASIHINGKLSEDNILLEREVIFEGNRLEPEYSEVSGQWGGLWIANGSINNSIEYLTLKNATLGIMVQGDTTLNDNSLTIKNSKIYNSQNINLWGQSAVINAKNLVLGNAGNISLYCNMGGQYSFIHSTIANYWKKGYRNNAALHIDNYSTINGNAYDLHKADFKNCIIYGDNGTELNLDMDPNKEFQYYFENCLIKFSEISEHSLYDFSNPVRYKNILLNLDPRFEAAVKNNFLIDKTSNAIDAGNLDSAALVPLDILGNTRTENPDLGAFEALFTN